MSLTTSTCATVIICAVLQLTIAQHGGIGKCPKPPVQPEFQLAPYLGVWYEIARYEVIFELGQKCNAANYTPLADGNIRVVNSGIKASGQPDRAVGEAMISDALVGAKLSVKFGEQSFPSEPNYWVLSTDYTNYSMVYSCEQFSEALHFELAWILSRTRTISSDLKEELLSEFEKVGVSQKPFHFTPQGEVNNCTYPGVEIAS